jgi:hypothetical protein
MRVMRTMQSRSKGRTRHLNLDTLFINANTSTVLNQPGTSATGSNNSCPTILHTERAD